MNKILLSLLIGVSFATVAGHLEHEKAGHHEKSETKPHTTSGLKLSPPLLALLNQEMQQIQVGMGSLLQANIAGDWETISKVGHNIKHSYIMAQQLTKPQRHELHQSLPQDFKKLDHKLHYYAGMLAHSAKEHDRELVNYYFYKMNETCTACHAQYAVHKFPGFMKKNRHESAKH